MDKKGYNDFIDSMNYIFLNANNSHEIATNIYTIGNSIDAEDREVLLNKVFMNTFGKETLEQAIKKLEVTKFFPLKYRASKNINDKDFKRIIDILSKRVTYNKRNDNYLKVLRVIGIEFKIKLTKEQKDIIVKKALFNIVSNYRLLFDTEDVNVLNEYNLFTQDRKVVEMDYDNLKALSEIDEEYLEKTYKLFTGEYLDDLIEGAEYNGYTYIDVPKAISTIGDKEIEDKLMNLYNNNLDKQTELNFNNDDYFEFLKFINIYSIESIEDKFKKYIDKHEDKKKFIREYVEISEYLLDKEDYYDEVYLARNMIFLHKYDLLSKTTSSDYSNMLYNLKDYPPFYYLHINFEVLAGMGELSSKLEKEFNYIVKYFIFSQKAYSFYIQNYLEIDNYNDFVDSWEDDIIPKWIKDVNYLYDLGEYFDRYDDDENGYLDDDEYLDNSLEDIETSDSYLNHLLIKDNLNIDYIKKLADNKNNYKNDTIHILYDYLLNIDNDSEINDKEELNKFAQKLNNIKQKRLLLDLGKVSKKAKQSDRFKTPYIKQLLVNTNMFKDTSKIKEDIIEYFRIDLDADLNKGLIKRLNNNTLTFGYMIIVDTYMVYKDKTKNTIKETSDKTFNTIFDSTNYKPFYKERHTGSQHWMNYVGSELFGININDDEGILPQPNKDVSYHANYGDEATLGWIKFHKDEDNNIIMVEEIQSDMVRLITNMLGLNKKQSNNLYLEINKTLLSQFSIYIHKNFNTMYKVYVPNAVTRQKYVGGKPTSFMYDAPAKAVSKENIKNIKNDNDLLNSKFNNNLTPDDKFYLIESLLFKMFKQI